MKRITAIFLWIALLASGTAHGGTIIQCDPNATGSAQYPNVACSAGGALSVSGTVTSSGNTAVVGPVASGGTIVGGPVLIGGMNGTSVFSITTDASGRLISVGGASNGSAPLGGPVLTGGSDGTLARTIRTDVTGQVAVVPGSGALTDCSGNITLGGTVQSIVGTNTARRYLLIQNQSVGDLYINFTVNATVGGGSVKIAAGNSFIQENGFVSTEALSIIGATTSQVFTCKYR